MKTNYLIFKNIVWKSVSEAHPPLKMKGDIKLFITASHTPDKRTKEYKELMKIKPPFYGEFSADVVIK